MTNDQNDNAAMRGPNYNWEHEAKYYKAEYERIQSLLSRVERSGEIAADDCDRALDALTVTQEEWMFRVRNLDIKNYKLNEALFLAKECMRFAFYSIQNQTHLKNDSVASLHSAKNKLENTLITIEELENYDIFSE